jgi:anti-sigma28 factor (negative regulator of flagellin synthesis)
MALPKSGKSDGNVTRLDDARKARLRTTTSSVKKPRSEPRVSNRRFDTIKVERIKREIARGEYAINYLQVADKFIEHERYA